MPKAATCVAMCQPSASRAIEAYTLPATISTSIMAAVSQITRRVRASPCALSRA